MRDNEKWISSLVHSSTKVYNNYSYISLLLNNSLDLVIERILSSSQRTPQKFSMQHHMLYLINQIYQLFLLFTLYINYL